MNSKRKIEINIVEVQTYKILIQINSIKRPKSKKKHSKSKSLAVAFIAFYNRAEQSQSIVFLAHTTNFTHPEKIKKTMHCEELNALHHYYNMFSLTFLFFLKNNFVFYIANVK